MLSLLSGHYFCGVLSFVSVQLPKCCMILAHSLGISEADESERRRNPDTGDTARAMLWAVLEEKTGNSEESTGLSFVIVF